MKKFIFASAALALTISFFWYMDREDAQTRHSLEKLKRLYSASEKEPKPEYPGEAAAYMAGHRQTPNDENPAMLSFQARQETLSFQNRQAGVSQLPNFQFEEIGPGNFGGRVRAIAINPVNVDNLLIGGVDGGVWKSTDGGETWNPQDDFMTNLAISSMVIDPDDSDTVFLGTGEGFFNVDAAQGLGIFRSNDFGSTWSQLPSTNTGDFFYVNRLAMVPGSDIIIAATRTGLWRSTDLGTSWNEVSGVTPNSRGFVDLKIDPSNNSRLYAFHYGGAPGSRFMMRSENSGATWTQLGAAEGIPTTNIGRMEVGIGSDGVVYIAVANNGSATNGLYRSPAGGNAFVKTASNRAFIERQGWYDLICGVDPSDSDRVFAGAVDVFATTDAGAVISRSTFWNPGGGQLDNYVHADIHNITFFPNDSNSFLIGCDGGVFKTVDGGQTFFGLNNNLRITQYYGGSVSPDGAGYNGGTQDNGSHIYYGDPEVWVRWRGGDGGFAAWDQQDPNFMYGSTPNGGIVGSGNGGSTSVRINLPGGSGAQFIQPFTIDPNDGNRMIAGGTSVFYEDNLRALDGSWQSISPNLGTINATTISPHNGAVAYVGTTGGAIHQTTNLGVGATWTNIRDAAMPGNRVTWVEVDTNDVSGNTLYATFSTFGPNRIWRSTDQGGSWNSISGNLPDIPLFCVRVDPKDPDRLFVGSELGIYTTGNASDPSPTWDHFNYGVAWTRVMQLHWAGNDSMYITTHGRSIYRAQRDPSIIEMGEIDDSNCDGDGYLEQGGTAEIPISVTNAGGFAMQSVSVSMTTDYAGLSIDNGPLNFGTIAPGNTVTQNFQVTLGTLQNCLDVANLMIAVDHSTGTGNADYAITLGADPDIQSSVFFDGAEGPTLITSEARLGINDWAPVSTQANSGTNSWFAANIAGFSDKSLISPWFEVGNGSTLLSFSLFYDMEGSPAQYWDGVVLELRTEGSDDWVDIGNLSTVPYDGQIFLNNSLEFRQAWSGTQTTWRDADVDLSNTYNGQTVQFRFRMGSDSGAANTGFWVDDINMTNVSWVAGLNCDTSTCCFNDLTAAQAAVRDRLPNWLGTESVATLINVLNNVCAP